MKLQSSSEPWSKYWWPLRKRHPFQYQFSLLAGKIELRFYILSRYETSIIITVQVGVWDKAIDSKHYLVEHVEPVLRDEICAVAGVRSTNKLHSSPFPWVTIHVNDWLVEIVFCFFNGMSFLNGFTCVCNENGWQRIGRSIWYVIPECDVVLSDKFEKGGRRGFTSYLEWCKWIAFGRIGLFPLLRKVIVESKASQFLFSDHV